MNTGYKLSKTKKCLTTIAALTGSAAIIGLSIAFVTTDFSGMINTPSFIINESNTMTALKPIREDETSSSSGDDKNNPNNNDDNQNMNGVIDNNNNEENIGNQQGTPDGNENNNEDSNIHGTPCIDPNCSIHNKPNENNDCTEEKPCGKEDCSICNGKPPVKIDMRDVNFISDSDAYVDKEAAKSVLTEYLDAFNHYFERYPDGKIYLVGGIAKTASWDLTETELSLARAEKVRQSFIELGVDADKLVAMGLGVSDPWRENEWSNGYFDEEIAKENRRVWIIPDQYEEQVRLVKNVDAMIKEIK